MWFSVVGRSNTWVPAGNACASAPIQTPSHFIGPFSKNGEMIRAGQFRYFAGKIVEKMVATPAIVSRKDIRFLGQDEASKIDELLFSKYHFKVEQLMELAGLACAKAINSLYPKGKALILCGPGNNGGDGFVCARHLQQFGYEPTCVYPKKSKNELMEILVAQMKALDIPVYDTLPELNNFSFAVDAMFGFSFKPPVREPFDEIISSLLVKGIFICSIDIPSGWDVEKGPPSAGPFVRPHSVVSLTAPKLCMKDYTGPHFLGGRFVPAALARDMNLVLPKYPDADQIVKIE